MKILWGPVQNVNAGHLFQIMRENFQMGPAEPSARPGTLLSMRPCVTTQAWKLVLTKSFDLTHYSVLRVVFVSRH